MSIALFLFIFCTLVFEHKMFGKRLLTESGNLLSCHLTSKSCLQNHRRQHAQVVCMQAGSSLFFKQDWELGACEALGTVQAEKLTDNF